MFKNILTLSAFILASTFVMSSAQAEGAQKCSVQVQVKDADACKDLCMSFPSYTFDGKNCQCCASEMQ